MIGGVPVESGQQIVQVGGGELPLERLCLGVVAVFECSEPVLDLVEVGEVGSANISSDFPNLKAMSAHLQYGVRVWYGVRVVFERGWRDEHGDGTRSGFRGVGAGAVVAAAVGGPVGADRGGLRGHLAAAVAHVGSRIVGGAAGGGVPLHYPLIVAHVLFGSVAILSCYFRTPGHADRRQA
ncbi:hypothetical protein [Saccharopolyspora pogona]|uniref:hypothetical protein n=1 Tax=Saccharopolyspora pogona TaxID=333966 RepID=UPI00168398CB|nr:hypothetical protein [Saccharopolyspora pogona]